MFVDRRTFLQGAAGVAVAAVCGGSFAIARRDDDALLDNLSCRCFQYFWDATDAETGICRDLIHGDPADNAKKGDEPRGSTGVTGFALTAFCFGAKRKWIAREQAKDRVTPRTSQLYQREDIRRLWMVLSLHRRSHRSALERRGGIDERLHLAACRGADLPSVFS
jgi:hypothetical protein